MHVTGKRHKKMESQQGIMDQFNLNLKEPVDTSKYKTMDEGSIMKDQFCVNGEMSDLLTCGVVPAERAPYVLMNQVVACKLCCNPCFDWFSWQTHFASDIHAENVKYYRKTHEFYYQKLSPGDNYVYYFDHLSKVWQWTKPVGMAENQDSFYRSFK